MIRPTQQDYDKAFKQLDDFFACTEEEGLDRSGLHIAWEVIKAEINFLFTQRLPLQTIRIAPGDAIVIHSEERLPMETMKRLADHTKNFTNKLQLGQEVPILIMDRGLRFGVVENGKYLMATAPAKEGEK